MIQESIHLPREIPVIVLPKAVLFPNSLLPLHIFEERYRAMLDHALEESRIFGVVQETENLEPIVPGLAEIMGVGVIRACVERADGTSDLILQGLARVKIVGEVEKEPFRILKVEAFVTQTTNLGRAMALAEKLKELGRALRDEGVRLPPQMDDYLAQVDDPEVIGDLFAATFVSEADRRQEILETAELEERLRLVLAQI